MQPERINGVYLVQYLDTPKNHLVFLIVVIIVAVVVAVDRHAVVDGAQHVGIDHLQRFRGAQHIVFGRDAVVHDENDTINATGNDLRIRESQQRRGIVDDEVEHAFQFPLQLDHAFAGQQFRRVRRNRTARHDEQVVHFGRLDVILDGAALVCQKGRHAVRIRQTEVFMDGRTAEIAISDQDARTLGSKGHRQICGNGRLAGIRSRRDDGQCFQVVVHHRELDICP